VLDRARAVKDAGLPPPAAPDTRRQNGSGLPLSGLRRAAGAVHRLLRSERKSEVKQ